MAERYVRLSPGMYRDTKTGKLVKSAKNPGALGKNPSNKPPRTPQQTAPQQTAPQQPTQAELVDQGFREGSGAYQNIVDRFQGFNPMEMQAQYQPGFTQEMDRARNNIMDTFNRRNQEAFGREREAAQLSIAERGLDPNSPAAQAIMREVNDRQDRARQEAMSAAETQAYQVQQQGFGQATDLAMLPYQQYQAIQDPYNLGIQNQYMGQQQEREFGYQKRLQELEGRQRLQQIRAGRSGGGGGGGVVAQPNMFNQYMEAEFMSRYGQQQPRANPTNAAIGGAFTGFNAAIENSLLKK